MKQSFPFFIIMCAAWLLAGCATSSPDFATITQGMNKRDVIASVGEPQRVYVKYDEAGQHKFEDLMYSNYKITGNTGDFIMTHIILINDKVSEVTTEVDWNEHQIDAIE